MRTITLFGECGGVLMTMVFAVGENGVILPLRWQRVESDEQVEPRRRFSGYGALLHPMSLLSEMEELSSTMMATPGLR